MLHLEQRPSGELVPARAGVWLWSGAVPALGCRGCSRWLLPVATRGGSSSYQGWSRWLPGLVPVAAPGGYQGSSQWLPGLLPVSRYSCRSQRPPPLRTGQGRSCRWPGRGQDRGQGHLCTHVLCCP